MIMQLLGLFLVIFLISFPAILLVLTRKIPSKTLKISLVVPYLLVLFGGFWGILGDVGSYFLILFWFGGFSIFFLISLIFAVFAFIKMKIKKYAIWIVIYDSIFMILGIIILLLPKTM